MSETGNITRLLDEVTAELGRGKRWSYWMPLIQAARDEHHRNEDAFEGQSKELEIAVDLLETLGFAGEYRKRAYPSLYPRGDE